MGVYNIEATASGFALAEAFAHADPAPVRIIASPMQRTRATATFVAERLNVPLETDDALIEIAHGTWEGRLRDEIAANDPTRYTTWRERPAEVAFEEGESLADVAARWSRFRALLRIEAPTLRRPAGRPAPPEVGERTTRHGDRGRRDGRSHRPLAADRPRSRGARAPGGHH